MRSAVTLAGSLANLRTAEFELEKAMAAFRETIELAEQVDLFGCRCIPEPEAFAEMYKFWKAESAIKHALKQVKETIKLFTPTHPEELESRRNLDPIGSLKIMGKRYQRGDTNDILQHLIEMIERVEKSAGECATMLGRPKKPGSIAKLVLVKKE